MKKKIFILSAVVLISGASVPLISGCGTKLNSNQFQLPESWESDKIGLYFAKWYVNFYKKSPAWENVSITIQGQGTKTGHSTFMQLSDVNDPTNLYWGGAEVSSGYLEKLLDSYDPSSLQLEYLTNNGGDLPTQWTTKNAPKKLYMGYGIKKRTVPSVGSYWDYFNAEQLSFTITRENLVCTVKPLTPISVPKP